MPPLTGISGPPQVMPSPGPRPMAQPMPMRVPGPAPMGGAPMPMGGMRLNIQSPHSGRKV